MINRMYSDKRTLREIGSMLAQTGRKSGGHDSMVNPPEETRAAEDLQACVGYI